MRAITTLFVSAGPVIFRAVSEDESAVERATDTRSDTHSAPKVVSATGHGEPLRRMGRRTGVAWRGPAVGTFHPAKARCVHNQ